MKYLIMIMLLLNWIHKIVGYKPCEQLLSSVTVSVFIMAINILSITIYLSYFQWLWLSECMTIFLPVKTLCMLLPHMVSWAYHLFCLPLTLMVALLINLSYQICSYLFGFMLALPIFPCSLLHAKKLFARS